MSFTLNLYNNSSSDLKAAKTTTFIASCTGETKGNLNLLRPTLVIDATEANVNAANYFTISGTIVRSFFIEEKTALTDTLWRITGKADLRATYKTQIQNSTGVIVRNENVYDMYLTDDKIPCSGKKCVAIQKFSGSTPFTHATGTGLRPITMLVIGGDA